MDVITAARQLGKAIQQDVRFANIMETQSKNDADKELQDAIGAFNLKRSQLNAEIQKQDKDADTIKELDAELKEMYAKIFENGNMQAFSAAKTEMEAMISQINQIISGSASGQNPDDIDPFASCGGGGCEGCSGCN